MCDHARGGVARAVVACQDVQIGVVLGEQGVDLLGEIGLAVVGGEQDGDGLVRGAGSGAVADGVREAR